ncbi:MAG: flagellar type III secretion system pore protein FliP [Clostridiales bacterium]|nr:flagellar type III secretion system pore protein FliP [Clostridiales bacterium]
MPNDQAALSARSPFRKFRFKKFIILFLITFTFVFILSTQVLGVEVRAAGINLEITPEEGTEGGALGTIEVLFLLVIVSLLPSILLSMTSFTRIVIALSFVRNALGLQQTPPNQVLIGIALFLSLFVMSPTLKEINEVAYAPYRNGEISFEQARENAVKPLKVFMLKQTQKKDLQLFLDISGKQLPEVGSAEELTDVLGLDVLVPSFLTSELKRAFTIGFLLFLPFLIIDIVVSSTLMSMGMVMLPPTTISLPFKILLFVLVDGWNLLFGTLVSGFR